MAHHISPLQETARAFFVPMALRHACCRPSRMLASRSSLRPFGPSSCFDLLQKVRSRSPAAQDPHLAGSPAPQVLTFGACFLLPFSRCGRHSFLPCRRRSAPLFHCAPSGFRGCRCRAIRPSCGPTNRHPVLPVPLVPRRNGSHALPCLPLKKQRGRKAGLPFLLSSAASTAHHRRCLMAVV